MRANAGQEADIPLAGLGDSTEPQIATNYFLPAFFTAQ